MAQREFFGREQVQPCPWRGVAFEAGPGTQHVQPGAKAGLSNHECSGGLPLGKPLGQVVGRQKDVFGFRATVLPGKIDVTEGIRVRGIVVPGERRGGHGRQRGQVSGALGHANIRGGRRVNEGGQKMINLFSRALSLAYRKASAVFSQSFPQAL